MARNLVGVKYSWGTHPSRAHTSRLTDDGRLDQDSETILDGMRYPGIRIDRRDFAVPRFQYASPNQSMQDGPLLGCESEDLRYSGHEAVVAAAASIYHRYIQRA